MGALISSLVFQPPAPTYSSSYPYFKTIGTALHHRMPYFFIENRGAKYTILFSHGNAEDLGMIYDWFCEISRQLQVNVFAYDYAGYGTSYGECSEEACYADIEAAYMYLTTVKKISPKFIVLYGRSLGSGPTLYLASQQAAIGKPVGGIVLQSPLLSIYRVAFHFRFTLPGDMFCNIDLIKTINSPVTIIHGTRDEVVPFWHGENLYFSCQTRWRRKPLWVDGAGHNNIEALLSADTTIFFDHLRGFLISCGEEI